MQRAHDRLAAFKRHLTASSSAPEQRHGEQAGPPVVIGAMVLDIQAQASDMDLEPGGTVPGTVRQKPGGVARNVAQALGQMCRDGTQKPLLISMVGDDAAGLTLLQHWKSLGFSSAAITTCRQMKTPTVVNCFTKDGAVAAGIAAVADLEAEFSPAVMRQFDRTLKTAPLLILDANLPAAVIEEACTSRAGSNSRIWFEPVSCAKSSRATAVLQHLAFISPNTAELVAMAQAVLGVEGWPSIPQTPDNGKMQSAPVAQLASLAQHIQILLQAGVKNIVLTMGSGGAALLRRAAEREAFEAHHIPAEAVEVANTSGAGDCLVAGACVRLLEGADEISALAYGMAAAQLTVESSENVPPMLERSRLEEIAQRMLKTCTSWEVPFSNVSHVGLAQTR